MDSSMELHVDSDTRLRMAESVSDTVVDDEEDEDGSDVPPSASASRERPSSVPPACQRSTEQAERRPTSSYASTTACECPEQENTCPDSEEDECPPSQEDECPAQSPSQQAKAPPSHSSKARRPSQKPSRQAKTPPPSQKSSQPAKARPAQSPSQEEECLAESADQQAKAPAKQPPSQEEECPADSPDQQAKAATAVSRKEPSPPADGPTTEEPQPEGKSAANVTQPPPNEGPKKLRVLLDMDGVLADFEGAALKLFRETYPDEPFVALEDRRGYYIKQQYTAVREDLGEKMSNLYATPNFFSNMEPIPSAIEAVKEMVNIDNTEVFFCTTALRKFENCLTEKYMWIERHLGHELVDKIIIARDKTMVNGHLLFDDKESVTGLLDKPSWEHILVTAYHNKNLEWLPPLQRLESWTDDWKSILEKKRKEVFGSG